MLVVLGVGVGWEPSPLRTPCLELSARRRGLRERRAPCSAARPLCTLHHPCIQPPSEQTQWIPCIPIICWTETLWLEYTDCDARGDSFSIFACSQNVVKLTTDARPLGQYAYRKYLTSIYNIYLQEYLKI